MGSKVVDATEFFVKNMTERELQGKVEDRAKACGWMFYHTHDSRHSSAGFPDAVLVRSGVIIFAELKRETGEVSMEQRAWLAELGFVSHLHAAMLVRDGGRLPPPPQTPAPWEIGAAWAMQPPMGKRTVQVHVWRPSDLFSGRIDEVLE